MSGQIEPDVCSTELAESLSRLAMPAARDDVGLSNGKILTAGGGVCWHAFFRGLRNKRPDMLSGRSLSPLPVVSIRVVYDKPLQCAGCETAPTTPTQPASTYPLLYAASCNHR